MKVLVSIMCKTQYKNIITLAFWFDHIPDKARIKKEVEAEVFGLTSYVITSISKIT